MTLYYTSEKSLHQFKNGKDRTLQSKRYESYLATLQSIHDTTAWKTSGTGAMFAGTYEDPDTARTHAVSFTGLSLQKDVLIYALRLDDMGGLYRKLDDDEGTESLVLAQKDTFFGGISVYGEKLALTTGSHPKLLHLAVLSLSDGSLREFTDGDTIEETPCWSNDGSLIYCSTAGYAQGGAAPLSILGPRSIAVLDLNNCTFDDLLSDEKFDYLRPFEDKAGNFYYIRQPYRVDEQSNLLEDILLFPGRIVKAIGGMLNWFSIRYGGEALRSGDLRNGNRRAKQKSEEDLFFEGNLIHAAKNAKESERRGDPYPSLMPRERVLIRCAPDGSETILAHGVLDYTVAESGEIYISNGQFILRKSADGKEETKLCKAKLAVSLVVHE